MNVAGGGFSGVSGGYYLALGKMDVYSGGKEIAALCPVTVDSTYGIDDDVAQVTRPARLGGETTFMDHPENVTDREHLEASCPQGPRAAHGRDAGGRRFPEAMEDNILYLLNSYSVDDLLRQFRERVGTAKPPVKPAGGHGTYSFGRKTLPVQTPAAS